MQSRGRGNVAAERLCGALFVGLTTLKGCFYINLGGTQFKRVFQTGATRPSSQFGFPVQFAYPETNERLPDLMHSFYLNGTRS